MSKVKLFDETNLTTEEKDFIRNIIKQANISLADPKAFEFSRIASSILAKLNHE